MEPISEELYKKLIKSSYKEKKSNFVYVEFN